MITDSFPLKVKLGGPALDLMCLSQITENLSSVQSTIADSRTALAKTRTAPSSKRELPLHKNEEDALIYAAKKRRSMNAYYLSESIFSEFQRVLLGIVEEERGARKRLDVFYNDIRRQTVNARRAEYFMGTRCVFERFDVEEHAHEEKVRMMQEYTDFLLSAKIVEEEERQIAIGRAQNRRKKSLQQSGGIPGYFAAEGANSIYRPSYPGYGYGVPLPPPPQQNQPNVDSSSSMYGRPYALPPVFLEMQQRRQQGDQQYQQPQTGFYASQPTQPYTPMNSSSPVPLQPLFPQQQLQQQQQPYRTNYSSGQPGGYKYQGL